MPVARVLSAAVVGLDAVPIEVESDISQGLPAFNIVGLPDKAVEESKERVRAAIKNSKAKMADRRLTINLAPADLPKIGPAYDLDFYLEMFGNLIKEKVDPDKLLRKYRVVHQQTRKKQAKFFIKLKIDKRHMHLFKVAQDIVFLKGWRKDILFLGFYAADQILKELAKRKGLSLMQMKYIWPSEIEDVVLRDKISVDELNERKKFSVLYMKNGKVRILIGDKARKFLAKQNFEKIKVVSIKEIKGMCACPGRVRGVVRVVNVPEDMEKMKKGDIMFSHTTFPALVPAMKKAAAIVTEDGGITCHAAIVSREMKTPCVVGVKSLLQVLKDGDRVEVDAADGEIKKLGN